MKKILYLFLVLITSSVKAQFTPNYDESAVPHFELPPLLISQSGRHITSPDEWMNIRRPELLHLFETQVYGVVPDADVLVSFKVVEQKDHILDGLARRKQVAITFSRGVASHTAIMLIYLPQKAATPVPLFVGYNFYGNHTIYPDPAILISKHWVANNPNENIFNNQADDRSRGFRVSRWPVLQILKRGYGLAVMYYGDIDPDFDDGFQNGIQPLYYRAGQSTPRASEWGSIGAWAFGLSKAMDYFEKDGDIDQSRVAVIGHSRLGKTSLWAGARDDRFAMVISNDSGCGGAALSRRKFGETVARINEVFPHWFCDNFNRYNNNEEALPLDQHSLIALIAPRPVYIASAEQDQWADPKGEYLSGYYASEVYRLFGLKGLSSEEMPPVNQPVNDGYVAYHIRTGGHDITFYDWSQYLDFADLHFKK